MVIVLVKHDQSKTDQKNQHSYKSVIKISVLAFPAIFFWRIILSFQSLPLIHIVTTPYFLYTSSIFLLSIQSNRKENNLLPKWIVTFAFFFPYDNLRKRLKGVSVCRIIISVPRFASLIKTARTAVKLLAKSTGRNLATWKTNWERIPCRHGLRSWWQRYLEPLSGLQRFYHGTIFEELNVPFLKRGCRLWKIPSQKRAFKSY